MKSLAIIRSEPLSPDRIRDCAEELQDRYFHLDFKWWDPDSDEGRTSDFIVDRLFDVRDFGIVYAVGVWFHAGSIDLHRHVERIRRVFDLEPPLHWRELWSADERKRTGDSRLDDDRNYELSIGCGMSHLGYYCCFDPLDESPAFRDRQYRRDLFERAIRSIGLQDWIRAFCDDRGDLRMTAESPWRLTHFSVQIDDVNPSGFNVNGFPTAEHATQAALAMLSNIGGN